jgi:hypothetical protein
MSDFVQFYELGTLNMENPFVYDNDNRKLLEYLLELGYDISIWSHHFRSLSSDADLLSRALQYGYDIELLNQVILLLLRSYKNLIENLVW